MSPLEYRPSIDGLRAVAVLSVFVFHLNGSWLPGGFVGVDVFFVISGYLITSIIVKGFRLGRFSLLTFYQRRIARIFPAYLAVVVATLLGATVIYSAQDLATAGANAAFATLSAANLKLLLQGNYFELSRDAQPFLHCWSLSLEEQFYLFFPVSLLLVRKWPGTAKTAALGAAGVTSLVGCVLLTRSHPAAAFYLLPTRAWELLVGCTLALLHEQKQGSLPSWLGRAGALTGLIMVSVSFSLLREGPEFPGYQAALPVVGAALVLSASRQGGGAADRFLSLRPMVSIGRMSYSLYLWHWPVFSLVDYRMYASPEVERVAWKVALTALATLASFKLIESPGRIFLNERRHRQFAFGFVGCAILLMVPVGFSIRRTNYVNCSEEEVARGGRVIGAERSSKSVVLMGDSQGSMYGGMMKDLAEEEDFRLTVISVAAGDPLPSVNGKSSTLWRNSLAAVQKGRPSILVLACDWEGKLEDSPARLPMALDRIRPFVERIIVLTQPPSLPENASRAQIRHGSRPPFFEDPVRQRARQAMTSFLRGLEDDKVKVVDVAPQFVSSRTGEVLFVDDRRQELYQDRNHLSSAGAAKMKTSVAGLCKGRA